MESPSQSTENGEEPTSDVDLTLDQNLQDRVDALWLYLRAKFIEAEFSEVVPILKAKLNAFESPAESQSAVEAIA